MNGFVPIAVAAQRSGMTYAAVYQLYRRNRVRHQRIYERPYIHLDSVLEHKRLMDALGTAKHAPVRHVIEESADAQPV